MKHNLPARPFGVHLLVVVAVTAGCAPSKGGGSSTGSTNPGSTAPVQSVTTMAYSMPSAQYPTGDSF